MRWLSKPLQSLGKVGESAKQNPSLNLTTRSVIAVQAQSLAGDALFSFPYICLWLSAPVQILPVGLLSVVTTVVGLSASLIGGPLIDRVSWTKLMAILDWLRMIIVAGLGLALGWLDLLLWIIYPGVALTSAMTILYTPSARSLTPSSISAMLSQLPCGSPPRRESEHRPSPSGTGRSPVRCAGPWL